MHPFTILVHKSQRAFRIKSNDAILFEGSWTDLKRYVFTCKLIGLIELQSDASALC